ncbi:EamA family transporter RarD [Clostridium beijerinckii]|uniref:EamA family transporter RarD n=1 Tax=Clostridium beijerinckii TaxID=1520 RepID=A0AAW3W3E9_CLOBE|nr:EamA family transporter RarD [Clostridium beijerinckii]MBC2458458.1 EamA family transporter RarD [Clostridium beijerinckii]MBC2473430.1 EamA family transporter RarD [Clostridium beijerinckii]NOV60401.1 chloramphenicol-sensitive protein RarD [Clostridium beijerinckii]NOV70823.1 chloramphenicol-sensitive protein RarD [Clostridium beijerinckii]NOW33741.1 chloramphenicol-sensitive protein RarD [Clostridium beijerinckii]
MRNEKTFGVLYAVSAYVLWGILPIYWKFVDSVSPMEILCNRIVWAFIFTILIIIVTKQWNELKFIVKDKKQMFNIFIASILIAINWGLYIWAVNSNRIVDASLGYYINPLLAVLLGVVIYKEKLSYWTGGALFIALIGVIIKTVQYGKIPWVSLGLAISFGLYGAIKKSVKANSIIGLTLEAAMLTPIAAAYMAFRHISGVGAFKTEGTLVICLLIGAGVVTAIPLLLFASGARRLPLSLIGFTQYISPTISLIIGIFMYNEGFTTVDMIAFGFIWVALILYTFSQVSLAKSLKNVEQIG